MAEWKKQTSILRRERHKCRTLKSRPKARNRLRKPANLKTEKPHEINRAVLKLKFQNSSIYLPGAKRYAFCEIDQAETVGFRYQRGGRSYSLIPFQPQRESRRAKNYSPFRERYKNRQRTLVRDNAPVVERFIGTLQRERLDYNYAPLNVAELSEVVDLWLDKAPI